MLRGAVSGSRQGRCRVPQGTDRATGWPARCCCGDHAPCLTGTMAWPPCPGFRTHHHCSSTSPLGPCMNCGPLVGEGPPSVIINESSASMGGSWPASAAAWARATAFGLGDSATFDPCLWKPGCEKDPQGDSGGRYTPELVGDGIPGEEPHGAQEPFGDCRPKPIAGEPLWWLGDCMKLGDCTKPADACDTFDICLCGPKSKDT
mmetsp:Transcript_14512/g.43457  ORF Transcript_14512/g.43457 Transcript_14512/m.43457 type:complete len:204 (+) Transcript_14512:60-671(+)